MITNKEVVSIQKLQMTTPLSAHKNYKYRKEEKELSPAVGQVMVWFYSVLFSSYGLMLN